MSLDVEDTRQRHIIGGGIAPVAKAVSQYIYDAEQVGEPISPTRIAWIALEALEDAKMLTPPPL
jgi:hypothetical protein